MRGIGTALGLAIAACLLGHLLQSVVADKASQRTGGANVGRVLGVGYSALGVGADAAKGPIAEAYSWRNVEIVGGGFVSGIVFSPNQPDLIYARTDIGGAYRWNPDRKRWTPLNDWVGQNESNLLGIESLAPDPMHANRLYAAVGTYTQSWAGAGAILRSNDQGRTWHRTDMPFKMGGNENGRSIGERLAIDPQTNGLLYFGSRNDGLWKSADFGDTWKKVDSFPVTGRTNGIGIGFVLFAPHKLPDHSSITPTPTSTIYVGVAAPGVNLYQSTDRGTTWKAVAGQPAGLAPHHGALDSDGKLYLTYGNGPGPNGMTDGAVWKYDTVSGAWTDITPVKPGTAGLGSFGYAGLALDAAHPGTVMVTSMDKWSSGDDIYRTTDGGAHWTALKAQAVRDSSASPFLNWGAKSAALGHWMGTIAIDPFHSGRVFYGTGATIWRSDDATNADTGQPTHWTVGAQGLEETAVLDLISPPSGAHLLSGLGDIGGFRHDDLTISPPTGMYANPILSNTDSLDFAECDPNIVARVGRGKPGESGAYSVDGGATWTPFASEPAGSRGGGVIAIAADGSAFLWTPRNGLAHFSKDRGATWTACKGLPNQATPLADRVNPGKFYALDAKAGDLYVSVNGGASFTLLTAKLPTERAKVKATPGKEGDLWLTVGNNGLYHAVGQGTSFTKLESVQEAYALGFGKAAPGQNYPALYMVGKVSDTLGVFRSDDVGATWTRINDDQHQYGWIGQVVIGDPRVYGRVYLGTNGRGILYADPVKVASSGRN